MAIYVRTAQGEAAVANPRTFLPPRLRALLAAVDGRVDPRRYWSDAWPAAEVQAMLDTLVKVGHVALVQEAAEPDPVAPAAETPDPSVPAWSPAPIAVRAGDELRQAVSLVSDFATRHLPQDAMELLFTLEAVSSPSELRSHLGDYEARVARLGPIGQRHLSELRTLLSAAGA